MTIHLGKYLGFQIRIMRGADGRRYACTVIWYPRSRSRLGYLYPSLRVWG